VTAAPKQFAEKLDFSAKPDSGDGWYVDDSPFVRIAKVINPVPSANCKAARDTVPRA
jgi:hypothetical protein